MSSLILKLTENGDFTLRGMSLPDGNQFFSVYDFIHKVCKYKDNGAHSRKVYQRLTAEGSEFKKEIEESRVLIKFPGPGQRETPAMTIRGLQRILMILEGKVAADFRALVEGTFTRVMAGDTSLISVIQANAASNAPIQQAYKAALQAEPVDTGLEDPIKKRKLEREEERFQMEMNERKRRLLTQSIVDQKQALENSITMLQVLHTLNPNEPIDPRTKLQIEDQVKNIGLFGAYGGNLAIENGASSDGISIASMSSTLGFRFNNSQVVEIGRIMAAKYRGKYNAEPPKHNQYVNGNVILVNSYMERDHDMMKTIIQEYAASHQAKAR